MTTTPAEEPRYYTTTTCPRCGAQVDGLRNRYACGLCGWVSPPEDEPIVIQPEE